MEDTSHTSLDQQSDWTSLWIANILSFCVALSFTIFAPTLWPFLKQLDPNASEIFFGFVVAAWSLGQALAAPAFGWWSNRIKQTKLPVAVGVSLLILSNLMFFFTETFPPDSRKWALLVARFLSGTGAGVVALLRSYAATASTLSDRHKAIGLVRALFNLGMAGGPALQAAVTPIGATGLQWTIFRFNMFTSCALISIVIDVVILVLLFLLFKERYAGIATNDSETGPLPRFSVVAALICISARFTLMTAYTNMETVQSPYLMIMNDWTKHQVSTYNSILVATFNLVGFATQLLFAYKLGKILNERVSVLIGFSMLVLYHIITFPWWFYSSTLDFQLSDLENSTTTNSSGNQLFITNTDHVGCPVSFGWCTHTARVPLWLYMAANILIFGIGLPLVSLSSTTMLSKVLGPRRQGTMTGFQLQAGSAARTIGPLVFMYLFTYEGPRLLWIVEIVMLIIGSLPWIFLFKQIVPFSRT